jgi:hypothetical protein
VLAPERKDRLFEGRDNNEFEGDPKALQHLACSIRSTICTTGYTPKLGFQIHAELPCQWTDRHCRDKWQADPNLGRPKDERPDDHSVNRRRELVYS